MEELNNVNSLHLNSSQNVKTLSVHGFDIKSNTVEFLSLYKNIEDTENHVN